MAEVEQAAQVAPSADNAVHLTIIKGEYDSNEDDYDESLVEEVVVTDGHSIILTSPGDQAQVPDPICEVISDGIKIGYSCLQCGDEFETAAAFELHDNTQHGVDEEPPRKRSRTGEGEPSDEEASTSDVANQVLWQCGTCELVFLNRESVEQHQLIHLADPSTGEEDDKDNVAVENDHVQENDDADPKMEDDVRDDALAKTACVGRIIRRVFNQYMCPGCNFKTNNKKYFASHLNQQHPGVKLLQCDKCSDKFASLRKFDRHVKCHAEGGVMHECSCGLTFTDTPSFNEHKTSCLDGKIVCEHCGEIFPSRAKYNTHTKMHEAISCDICMKKFINKYTLDTHMARIHGQVREGVVRNLKKYYRTDVRSDPCPFCSKTFCNDYVLEAHIKEHKGEYAYECEVCGKPFNYKHSLKAHMEQHENHAYTCPKCNGVYKTKVSLNTHIRTVHRPKKHTCKQCGRKFATSEHIRAHMRTHTGEKPYKCEYCTQSFAQLATLQNHVRNIHHRLKPYKCDRCDEEFHRPGQLEKHLQRFHGGSSTFQCVVCGEIFASVRVLKTHLMELHVDELSSESESDDRS